MKKIWLILTLFCGVSFQLFSDALEDYLSGILTYLSNNNLMIYKDATVLSSEKAINLYLRDLISGMGKNNFIEFLVRTKKNGIYRVCFLVKDNQNQWNEEIMGNILSLSANENSAKNYYSMENLDALTILFRYREKEALSLEDYIYLLNSMLYKDSTITSMLEQKEKNQENKTEDDQKRIGNLKKDLIHTKIDIHDVAQLIIHSYQKEIDQLSRKTARSEEEERIIREDKEYLATYQRLKEVMGQQVKKLRNR